MKSHITLFSRRTHPTSFSSLKSSSRSGKQDDNLAIELAHNGELPGIGGSNIRDGYPGLERSDTTVTDSFG